jgi:hypothetical protein
MRYLFLFLFPVAALAQVIEFQSDDLELLPQQNIVLKDNVVTITPTPEKGGVVRIKVFIDGEEAQLVVKPFEPVPPARPAMPTDLRIAP